MYNQNDARSALIPAAGTGPAAAAAAPEYIQFDLADPAEVSAAGSPTWYFRGQNFVLAYTRLRAGDTLDRREQHHEYLLLLTALDSDVDITAGADRATVTEPAVVVVPPGPSSLTAGRDTAVVRLFDGRTGDLMDKAANAGSYTVPHANVTPLVPWPDPVDGDRLRVYLTERIPPETGRFGRIFRTSAFMINFLELQQGPRDPEQLSPHHHDNFEQCSLAVEGSYMHHIRTPWTTKRSEWREDQHTRVGSPSVAIIPPPTVHTSEAVGPARNQLIDIFCPPRADFSAREGWVLNAAEYPGRSEVAS
ncbi:hypothetical protein ABZS66_38300 [Dactylosporangium sp. NPDC005572]|uniref:hypothetical protein n=1 Tax=Dactylosporangium sp. NPDC005572 TaxID=3156889 RepID=UPI0033AE3C17